MHVVTEVGRHEGEPGAESTWVRQRDVLGHAAPADIRVVGGRVVANGIVAGVGEIAVRRHVLLK